MCRLWLRFGIVFRRSAPENVQAGARLAQIETKGPIQLTAVETEHGE
jgi:hypothetical protein